MTGSSEGWITTDDGVDLYYTKIGTGPQVVVVPCGFYFEDDFEPLSRDRTLVLLHQRGRGRSVVPEGVPVDIAHEAADLDVVRRALGIERWSLIGWSYLGLVTALYAIEHPDAVDRLVHLCSLGPDNASYEAEMNELRGKGFARTDPADLQRLNEMGAQGLPDSDPVAYAKQLARVIVSGQLANRSALERVSFASTEWPNEWLWRRPGLDGWTASFQAWDERERLPSIEAPMLVVHSLEDLIPLRAARDMASLVPNARLFTIEGSGHWPWLERPNVLFPAVDSFLAGEWPEGAELVT